MPQVFQTANLDSLELKNRLIHSATFECMADENGAVTDPLVKRYVNLAKGEVGLIIPGLITAIYTLGAGYWGVVMGDFLQGIVAIFAIVLVSILGEEAQLPAGNETENVQSIVRRALFQVQLRKGGSQREVGRVRVESVLENPLGRGRVALHEVRLA